MLRHESPAIQALRFAHVSVFSIVSAAADGRLDIAHDEASRLLDRLGAFLKQEDLSSPVGDFDDA